MPGRYHRRAATQHFERRTRDTDVSPKPTIRHKAEEKTIVCDWLEEKKIKKDSAEIVCFLIYFILKKSDEAIAAQN